jgi:hypothetical protein
MAQTITEMAKTPSERSDPRVGATADALKLIELV